MFLHLTVISKKYCFNLFLLRLPKKPFQRTINPEISKHGILYQNAEVFQETDNNEIILKCNIMKTKKIWSNLAVSDLGRTTKFYTELGFKSNGNSIELTSFFVAEDNFVMHFFLKDILKTIIKGEIADSQKVNEVLFTLSSESKEQVNKWEKEVERAGGKIISKPEEFGKGYYGFVFADPDGHRFNVFYMEGL